MIVESDEKINCDPFAGDPTMADPDAAKPIEEQLADMGEDLERHLVAQILRSEQVLSVAKKHLPAKLLASAAHKMILAEAYAHWDECARIIPAPILISKIRKAVTDIKSAPAYLAEMQVCLEYTPVTEYSAPSYVSLIIHYARRVALLQAYRDYHENGKIEALYRGVADAQQIDGTASQEYELFGIAELDDLPDLVWQIENHFPKNGTVTVFGSSGAGKSFLCLDMALSIAHGVPYLGKWSTVKGNVLYLCSEGSYGLKGRVGAWHASRGLKPSDAPNIAFSTTSHDLQERGEAERLIAKAKMKLGTVDIVFVDTLSRNFGGGDTDKNQDMQAYLGVVDWIRESTGATVVNVHHTGHGDAQRERGAKALRDYCDSSICVAVDGDRVEVTCKKQKDAAEFGGYFCSKVATGNSLTLKVDCTKAEDRLVKNATKERGRTEELLALIPGIDLGDSPTEVNTVTSDFLVKTAGIKKKTVSDALNQWVTEGTVFRERKSSTLPYRYWRCSSLS